MRIYPNLIRPVTEALESILHRNEYADKVIERTLKSNPKWGARDRSFIASTVYEVVRWKRYFAWLTRQNAETPDVRHLAALYWQLKGYDITPLGDIRTLPSHMLDERKKEAWKIRAVRESIPDWLDETGNRELGSHWETQLKSLNTEAFVVLRANRLKCTTEELQEILLREGVETKTDPSAPDALILQKRINVFRIPEFKLGFFEVQDKSSQEVSIFLKPEPGMRVVDACAGAGGKSLHLASLMQNRGRILSLDVEENKLHELKLRARRAGASIIETRLITSSKVIKRLDASFDRVLLDVPCSGLGVLRRNPDAKWKLTPEFIDDVKKKQAEILSSYSRMVKPGGILVYSTCSILPSENQEQVKKFMEGDPPFTLEEEKTIFPAQSGFDGFYMARLKRKDFL